MIPKCDNQFCTSNHYPADDQQVKEKSLPQLHQI